MDTHHTNNHEYTWIYSNRFTNAFVSRFLNYTVRITLGGGGLIDTLVELRIYYVENWNSQSMKIWQGIY